MNKILVSLFFLKIFFFLLPIWYNIVIKYQYLACFFNSSIILIYFVKFLSLLLKRKVVMMKKTKGLFGVAAGLFTIALTVSSQAMQADIRFYEKDQPFYEFANFFEAPFEEVGVGTWKTSEHYFQGKKFNAPGTKNLITDIRNADSARKVFDIAGDNWQKVRYDWEGNISKTPIGQTLRDNVMLDGLRLKFSQNQELADLLMKTNGLNLIENTAISTQKRKDSYWGNAYDKNGNPGHNRLGISLEKIRDELLNGTLNVNRSKKGASVTYVTKTAMATMGRPLNTHQLNSPSFSSKTQVEEIITNFLKVNHNLYFYIAVSITPNKNMIINVRDDHLAKNAAALIRDYSNVQASVDQNNPKQVFIPRGDIEKLLRETLDLDSDIIIAYKAENGL